jgi:hypothetical protein
VADWPKAELAKKARSREKNNTGRFIGTSYVERLRD